MKIKNLILCGAAFGIGFYTGNYMHSHPILRHYVRVRDAGAIVSIINSKTKEQYIITKDFNLKYRSELEKKIF